VNQVKNHYETLLAAHYSWMLGDFDDRIAEWENWLTAHSIRPRTTGIALDLGAGSGLPAIPLARQGFTVLAIDFSGPLLNELESRRGDLPIQTLEADILNFDAYSGLNPEVITCTTDTILHLPGPAQVQQLFYHLFVQLAPGGKFILTFRDLSQELTGTQRFIPVRSDENRILSCFLEYFPAYVQVYDQLWERRNGNWQHTVSSYRKLRMSTTRILSGLSLAGFADSHTEVQRGMYYIIASKK
jgi:protein-L-isoaspartate O-methyltransferase